MKKLLTFFLLAALSTSAFAWRNNGWGNDPYDSDYGNSNINSIRMGDYTFDNGQIGGDSYNSMTIDMGNYSFSNGSLGNRNFNCSTIRMSGGYSSTNCY